MWLVNDKPITDAVNQGSAATSAAPKVTAAHSQRGRPAPGAATQTSATVAASSSPVGVSPANASQKINSKSPPGRLTLPGDRSASIAVAAHGRQP